jgi:S-layer homology domain
MVGVHTLGVSSRVSLALFLILASSSLAAQQSPSYGVDSTSIEVVSAWDMEPFESQTTWAASKLNAYRFLTNAGALFGIVHVPEGASLLSIELDACDTSGTHEVVASFARLEATGFTPLAQISTGDGPTPGCARFAADLTAGPETVDNMLYQYIVSAQNGTFTGTTTIGAMRIVYRLQVSPAPGQATFNDVPTSDPAFQFVEALAASGITAGCGGGNYCPDATLTRRQMAVFLAKALGLHWPAGALN